jgi:hypothetical protein
MRDQWYFGPTLTQFLFWSETPQFNKHNSVPSKAKQPLATKSDDICPHLLPDTKLARFLVWLSKYVQKLIFFKMQVLRIPVAWAQLSKWAWSNFWNLRCFYTRIKLHPNITIASYTKHYSEKLWNMAWNYLPGVFGSNSYQNHTKTSKITTIDNLTQTQLAKNRTPLNQPRQNTAIHTRIQSWHVFLNGSHKQ